MKFRQLGISRDLAMRLENNGFVEAFEVQEAAIPEALKNIDIAVKAKTGSGKTLAFGIPLAELVEKKSEIQALVMTPTRELAMQISKVIKKISKASVALIYGGVGYGPQFDALKRADIVVGTPGRVLDHMRRGTIKANLKYFILDEADRMLDMGFAPDIRKVMNMCQPERVWLYSATLENSVLKILGRRNFHKIDVGKEMPDLDHMYIEANSKVNQLKNLLGNDKTLIFCNTKRMTQKLGEILRSPALHGDMSQAARERNMKKFRDGQQLLVATDVAARGIDIPEVNQIINFDVPKDRSTYVHRSGRTGRAGRKGRVITLLRSDDHDNFRKLIHTLDLEFNRLN